MAHKNKSDRLIELFEKAVRKHEFMGSQHPGDHKMIEGNYKKAKKDLKAFIEENCRENP